MRTKLVRDRLMEQKFAQYIEAKFPSDGNRGTSGVIHAAYANNVLRIQKSFQRSFVTL